MKKRSGPPVLVAFVRGFWLGAIPIDPERVIAIGGGETSALPVPGSRRPLFEVHRGRLVARSAALVVDGRPAVPGTVIAPSADLRHRGVIDETVFRVVPAVVATTFAGDVGRLCCWRNLAAVVGGARALSLLRAAEEGLEPWGTSLLEATLFQRAGRVVVFDGDELVDAPSGLVGVERFVAGAGPALEEATPQAIATCVNGLLGRGGLHVASEAVAPLWRAAGLLVEPPHHEGRSVVLSIVHLHDDRSHEVETDLVIDVTARRASAVFRLTIDPATRRIDQSVLWTGTARVTLPLF